MMGQGVDEVLWGSVELIRNGRLREKSFLFGEEVWRDIDKFIIGIGTWV